VPLQDAKALFDMCPSEKKIIWVIAGASHAKCAEVGGEVYRNKVAAFFNEYLREPAAAQPGPEQKQQK